jgi:hypothetical protein
VAEKWLPADQAGDRMDKADSKHVLEAVPRDDAVKIASTPDRTTPKALLAERLHRLYQPAAEAQPDRLNQLLMELEQRLAERRRD